MESRRRWENNIRMHLEEIGINEGTWVDSAQDVNAAFISHGVSYLGFVIGKVISLFIRLLNVLIFLLEWMS